MFVAGLSPRQPKEDTAAKQSAPAAQGEPARAPAGSDGEAKADVPALVVSPELQPHDDRTAGDDAVTDGEYESLKDSLRKLVSTKSKSRMWQTPGRGDLFRMVMVDKVGRAVRWEGPELTAHRHVGRTSSYRPARSSRADLSQLRARPRQLPIRPCRR